MPTLVDTPPPPVETGSDGGGSDWIPLTRAANDIDAHLLEGRLNTAGIEVRSVKDRTGPSWLLGGHDPWAPVSIWVRRFQYEDSRIVLAEVSFAGPAADRSVVDSPGWRPVVWWAVAIALGVAFTGVGLARSAEYIDRCGFSSTCESAP
jgi:hypothetical protein